MYYITKWMCIGKVRTASKHVVYEDRFVTMVCKDQMERRWLQHDTEGFNALVQSWVLKP